jgi:protease-4
VKQPAHLACTRAAARSPSSVPARARALALLSTLAWLGCGSREDESNKRPSVATLYELDLREPMREQTLSLLGETQPGLHEALTKVRGLLDEPLAKGLFVRLGELSGSFGDLADWSALFDAYRAAKRPVHCHFDTVDNLGFALATHCDRVTMTPAGTLDLVGIAAQLLHGRQLLEQVGVQADLLQVGKYKGASEPFTRDEPSEELKQSLNGLLDDLDRTLRTHLAQGGKRDPAQVDAALEKGPYGADDALAQKLIDAVGFDDEARSTAKKAAKAAGTRAVFPKREHESLSLKDLLSALAGKKEPALPSGQRLALAYLVGEIVDGEGAGMESSASDPFVKALRRFGDDERISAVVLRIESPGGSALASDRMWHAVRRVAARKPVIVSVGDMAASGGYYVASAGTYIVASEGSVLGSIGVVGGKLVASKLAERIGVHSTTLARGPQATWLSALAPFTPGERERLDTLLSRTYALFLERVSVGRKRSVEQLAPAAEGRVMGGARAKQLGLVDEVGGLSRAIAIARERGHLDKSSPVVQWPEEQDPFGRLSQLLGVRGQSSVFEHELALLSPELQAVVNSKVLRALAHNPARPVATLPFELTLR